ncbi:Phosphatidylglycerophosphatase A (EC [Olavius algarvensis Delta 1 endosymbiont]|nr:Phosphatidylglycerophosphatase A (EC [Olavius algarvensis Delta 1 endosymbiont]
MKFKDAVVVFLATGFYVGKIPFAPGTFGTLWGLPLCFFLAGMKLPLAVVCVVLLIALAIWLAHAAEKVLKQKDPGCIVIDEIAGMVVTMIGLPFNLTTASIGYIIFRILDIAKPFPIKTLDKRVSGGAGIVIDDVVAGMFANLLLRLILTVS